MNFEGRIYISLPFVLRILAGVLVLAAVTSYSLFQARHLISGPIITLTQDLPATTSAPFVVIKGKAENITAITLNGRTIFTSDDGSFEDSVVLQNGYTIVTIEAVDRYGHHASVVRRIVRM